MTAPQIDEWIVRAGRLQQEDPNLRCGQSFMIALHALHPELYDFVCDKSTLEIDCFYVDGKVPKLISYLQNQNTIDTIKIIVDAYQFKLEFCHILEKWIVTASEQNCQFFWDSTYTLQDFFDSLKEYFICVGIEKYL